MHPNDPQRQHQTRVVCPRCATTNHLPASRVDQRTVCGSCGHTLFTGATPDLDEESFDRQVSPSDLPVAVVFWAGRSPAARQMARDAKQAGVRAEPVCRVALVDGEQEQPLLA